MNPYGDADLNDLPGCLLPWLLIGGTLFTIGFIVLVLAAAASGQMHHLLTILGG